jgi:hypothetical protein
LGPVLRPARPGGHRRHLEVDRHVGRHRQGHGRDGPLHQHARRREGDGASDREEDRFG